MKFALQFPVKINSQSILASFTDEVLQFIIMRLKLNGLGKLYTINSLVPLHHFIWEIRV